MTYWDVTAGNWQQMKQRFHDRRYNPADELPRQISGKCGMVVSDWEDRSAKLFAQLAHRDDVPNPQHWN
jgi:hypothetical protein